MKQLLVAGLLLCAVSLTACANMGGLLVSATNGWVSGVNQARQEQAAAQTQAAPVRAGQSLFQSHSPR